MYQKLIRLILIGIIADFGASLDTKDVVAAIKNPSRIVAMTKQATKVDWKPIVVFPEDAARFR